MGDTERRLATLEAKFAAMDERRRKIIPPELYDDPNIQELAREAGKGMVEVEAVIGTERCQYGACPL
jgi:hypothetical protein